MKGQEREGEKGKFIRALWGVHDHQGRKHYMRRGKMDSDMDLCLKNPFDNESIVYVFGEDNYRFCSEMGFDCKLIHKDPIVWDMDKEQFRHKLEVFNKGLEDYGEIVFLDWDTLPFKKIPDNFWTRLREKDSFQAALNLYHKAKAYWRIRDRRKVSCAAFVYLNDKEISEGFISHWEEIGRPWSEEVTMASFIDKVYKKADDYNIIEDKERGWLGLDNYWDKHEPHWFCAPKIYWSYDKEKMLNEKDLVFTHFNKKISSKILRTYRMRGYFTDDQWLNIAGICVGYEDAFISEW